MIALFLSCLSLFFTFSFHSFLTLGETPPEREATPQGATARREAIVFGEGVVGKGGKAFR